MGIRYDNRNRSSLTGGPYRDTLKERGANRISYFTTAHLGGLSASVRSKFKRIEHIWGAGDRFYKLAEQYYGNPKLWWVIAWYNTTHTETHVEVGDTIKVPMPLERILYYFNNPRI